jgi:DNA-binding PucR family transcriptional regulator
VSFTAEVQLVSQLHFSNSRVFSDAFQRREKASEDYAIRQREKEKLIELKKKLQEQQQHLDRLSKHMYDPQQPSVQCSSI